MSDPSNPYGSGGATPYGAQPAYGRDAYPALQRDGACCAGRVYYPIFVPDDAH